MVAVTQAEVIGRRRAVAIAADQAVANPIPLAIPRDRTRPLKIAAIRSKP